MQKKSAGSENLIGVGGSIRDGTAKIWGQLVVGLLSNFKNRILGGWLSPLKYMTRNCLQLPLLLTSGVGISRVLDIK